MKGFTLMELIIVVVIVGVITGFALPNYRRAMAKADERNMIVNLGLMRAGMRAHSAGGGAFVVWGNLATINNNLGLAVIDRRANYTCTAAGGCRATHAWLGWRLQFDSPAGDIHCGFGTCPTCPAAGVCG